MPPHRDWTRQGAGRALLYWPLVAFILAAAFPALAVPLVVGSGFTLLVVGLIGGFAGKRRRARKLARARRAVAGLAEEIVPGAPRSGPSDDTPEHPTASGHTDGPDDAGDLGGTVRSATGNPAAWPTGRHARRTRSATAPGAAERAEPDAA